MLLALLVMGAVVAVGQVGGGLSGSLNRAESALGGSAGGAVAAALGTPSGGSWVGVVGATGYSTSKYGTSMPASLQPTAFDVGTNWDWESPSTSPLALDHPTGGTKSLSAWYAGTIQRPFRATADVTGTASLYFVDPTGQRSERLEVEINSTVVHSEVISQGDMNGGHWVQYDFDIANGDLINFKVFRVAGPNSKLSGILFDFQ